MGPASDGSLLSYYVLHVSNARTICSIILPQTSYLHYLFHVKRIASTAGRKCLYGITGVIMQPKVFLCRSIDRALRAPD